MARSWIAIPSAATALTLWLWAGGGDAAGRARGVGSIEVATIESAVPPPPDADAAPSEPAPPEATVDWLLRVDTVFESETTLRAKIAACAEAGRAGQRPNEGRIWSFAQGIADDAEFRVGAWELVEREKDPDVLLWLGHWLRYGLLGLEPGGRRTAMIPVMLYGEPWQRRRAAIYAACTNRGDANARPPETVWSALRSVLADESHPAVLSAAVAEWSGCELRTTDMALLFRAVGRLGAGEEQRDAARIVARRPPRLVDASGLLDLASTDAERGLWLNALAERTPPHEETDAESTACFARLYRSAAPEARLALLRSPESAWRMRTTLQGLLADEQTAACRQQLTALLAPRRR